MMLCDLQMWCHFKGSWDPHMCVNGILAKYHLEFGILDG